MQTAVGAGVERAMRELEVVNIHVRNGQAGKEAAFEAGNRRPAPAGILRTQRQHSADVNVRRVQR